MCQALFSHWKLQNKHSDSLPLKELMSKVPSSKVITSLKAKSKKVAWPFMSFGTWKQRKTKIKRICISKSTICPNHLIGHILPKLMESQLKRTICPGITICRHLHIRPTKPWKNYRLDQVPGTMTSQKPQHRQCTGRSSPRPYSPVTWGMWSHLWLHHPRA